VHLRAHARFLGDVMHRRAAHAVTRLTSVAEADPADGVTALDEAVAAQQTWAASPLASAIARPQSACSSSATASPWNGSVCVT
jgi:hypothetical protein